MSKKKLGLFIAPVLALGLAACNDNDENSTAYNTQNGDLLNDRATNRDTRYSRVNYQYPFDHQGPLAENYNDNRDIRNNGNRNGNRYNTTNVRNENGNRDFNSTNVNRGNNRYPFDHQGPLTEDYNRDNRNGANRIDRNRVNVNDRNNNNIFINDKRRNGNVTNVSNKNDISSSNTNMSSNQFPHTRAILIQEARYQVVPFNPNLDTQKQRQLRRNHEVAQSPEQQRQAQQATTATTATTTTATTGSTSKYKSICPTSD